MNKTDARGWSPTYVAAEIGKKNCPSMLIDAKADVDKAENEGCTPAYIAASEGQKECFTIASNCKSRCG